MRKSKKDNHAHSILVEGKKGGGRRDDKEERWKKEIRKPVVESDQVRTTYWGGKKLEAALRDTLLSVETRAPNERADEGISEWGVDTKHSVRETEEWVILPCVM